jgi:hypothetical protein
MINAYSGARAKNKEARTQSTGWTFFAHVGREKMQDFGTISDISGGMKQENKKIRMKESDNEAQLEQCAKMTRLCTEARIQELGS